MNQSQMFEKQENKGGKSFAFTLFMYSAQPWSDSRCAEGGVVTDGQRVVTFLKNKLDDPNLIKHFAICADCAAKDSLAIDERSAQEVMEATVAQAVDKGTAISFSRVRQIAAKDFVEVVDCIRECYMQGEKASLIN